jgi:hypothetical protein
MSDFEAAREAFEEERARCEQLHAEGAPFGEFLDAFARAQEHFRDSLAAFRSAVSAEPARPSLRLVKGEDDA